MKRLATVSPDGDILEAIRAAVLAKLPSAVVTVTGARGHYTLDVEAPDFAGKNRVAAQRLVLGAIAHLMAGDGAPVHAVDKLTTRVPAGG